MHTLSHTPRYGIVGGLGALGVADIFSKILQAAPPASGAAQAALILELHAFAEGSIPGARGASQNGRKLYVFEMIRAFEARRLDAVILPCFLSHTFLSELQSEACIPIVSMMDALRSHLACSHGRVRRLGVLTSDYVREHGVFDRALAGLGLDLLYPSDEVQQTCVMPAIYGPEGIKAGTGHGAAIQRLEVACQHLQAQGAELIIPGFTEIPLVLDHLLEAGFPLLDCNRIYARHVWAEGARAQVRPFKIGVLGGVGPAATVDFVGKIVRHTPAGRDQEHIKLVVEQNPQIPDRTAHLLGQGADPTIALYATCKRLEAADADIIAIPCNTAHAFVARLQPYLGVPVVNMLEATVEHIREILPPQAPVGLLATQGTVQSGIYAEAAAQGGVGLLVPDEAHQALVTAAIYGERGVKAGFIDEASRQALLQAVAHLVVRGARAIILGCTELPLLLSANPALCVHGQQVAILDPTEILARKCIALARARYCPSGGVQA